MKALLASAIEDGNSIGRVRAILTRGSQEVHQDLVVDLAQMTASGTVPKLMIGTWELRVDVYDQQGKLIYAGTADVLITESKTTGVELPLVAAPGRLELILDMSGFESYALVKGKVIIGNGEHPEVVKEFAREETTELQVTIEGLPPRTHDLLIEIYKNTYHSYNCIYRGPWQVFTVEPGLTTEVHWSPAWGCIEIIGIIDTPPPSPVGVSAVLQGDAILVCWDPVNPVEDDLVSYGVYVQVEVFTGFQLVATVDNTTHSFVYEPLASSLPSDTAVPIQIAVSSMDAGGNESNRSSPVMILWSASP